MAILVVGPEMSERRDWDATPDKAKIQVYDTHLFDEENRGSPTLLESSSS
jgi:hypothetical protein